MASTEETAFVRLPWGMQAKIGIPGSAIPETLLLTGRSGASHPGTLGVRGFFQASHGSLRPCAWAVPYRKHTEQPNCGSLWALFACHLSTVACYHGCSGRGRRAARVWIGVRERHYQLQHRRREPSPLPGVTGSGEAQVRNQRQTTSRCVLRGGDQSGAASWGWKDPVLLTRRAICWTCGVAWRSKPALLP